MKKYILVLFLLMLSGCNNYEYNLICDSTGQMYYQYKSSSQSGMYQASPFQNRGQVCINQIDGSILVKNVNK